MQSIAPGITVNGVTISSDEINAEVQYHPAETLKEAKFNAMQALVIRELLVQRAAEKGMCERAEAVTNPDAIIDELLAGELSVPEPDEESCKRYYENNRSRFMTSPLWEVSHILYLAPTDDPEAEEKARAQAEAAVERLRADPSRFEDIARSESACSSAEHGGRLGQISRGQTMPGFEAALNRMSAGDTSEAPVRTSVGFHVIKVHERADGSELPYDAVADWIREHLSSQSWQRAFSQYIRILAGKSKISGFIFKGADSPLVQ